MGGKTAVKKLKITVGDKCEGISAIALTTEGTKWSTTAKEYLVSVDATPTTHVEEGDVITKLFEATKKSDYTSDADCKS